jgi:hypothetical protein
MKVKRWEIEYLDREGGVVGHHPEFCISEVAADVAAALSMARYGAVSWRTREVSLRV